MTLFVLAHRGDGGGGRSSGAICSLMESSATNRMENWRRELE